MPEDWRAKYQKALQDNATLREITDRDVARARAAEARVAELEAALGECLIAAHGQDAANNAVKRIVRDAMVKPLEEKGKNLD